jgi:hypothetical protein
MEIRVPSSVAVLAVGLVAAIACFAAPAGAATRVGPATTAGGGQSGIAATCRFKAMRTARLIAEPHRRAARSRSVRRACLSRLRRNRARARQASDTPNPAPLAVGIDGHYAGWTEEEIQDREALNAPVTRHEWDLDNPVSSEEQQMLAAATEIHTRVLALLGGNDIGDATHYRNFVVEFIRYWGPGGTFWASHPELDESRYAITSIELGNEPYFGAMSAADYADTVRPTLEAVAQLGVPVKVILPSYIYGQNTSWIDTLYARIPNLNELFYAFADHPYWYGHDPAEDGGNGPFERIETLRARMAYHGAGAKPIDITEYGESTAACGEECVSEGVQAQHLQEMLNAVIGRKDWGIEMFLVFQLRDRGTESTDREQQFGLLRQDDTPKPAYSILRSAMQQYRG